MSEFLAEARIVVVPDTTRFRRDLEAQLAAATGKPLVVPVQAQIVGAASREGADAAARQAAIAQAAVNAEMTKGAEKTRAASVATKELAAQQTLASTAAQKLAFAEAEVAGAASGVGAAQVRLTRSAAAVAAAERALAAAVEAKNIALIDAAALSLRTAEAYAVEAEAALFAARAEAAHARTLGSVGTAGIASGASLLGLRGAVLTAGAAFLGATVAFQAGARAIRSASDTVEELNKSVVVFGDASQEIREFADTAATSLGISNLEALKATGIFGNLFRSINITKKAAADMSIELVQLSSDLASFNNADPSQVLENIRSGLVGEPEPLRKFGIFLSQVRAQQEALIVTGKKSIKQLTQSEIVQARYNIILRDAAIANNDFANTSDSLANQTRILTAQIKDLGADLGAVLIPALRNTVDVASDYVGVIRTAAGVTEDFASKIPLIGESAPGADSRLKSLAESALGLYGRFVLLGPVMGAATLAIDKFGASSEDDSKKVDLITDSIERLRAAISLIPAQVAKVNFKNITQGLNALEVAQLEIQTGVTPGGQAAEEANLRKQIEEDQRLVDAAASGTRARREALEKLHSDQQALAALQQKAAQDAEANARASKDAALDAQKAQQEADRALLEILSSRLDDAQRRAARAASTAGLSDDIRSQDRIQALIKIQIAKIRSQVRDVQARKDAIRELRIALIASRQEEDALRKERAAAASARRDEIQNLNIQIAEERGNKSAIERAIQTRIDTLNKQIKAAKGDQVKMKQLILERERLKNQLAELNKQQEDAAKEGKTFAQAAFEFAQSLQGFSANLLGNLIPGFATGGLVGGSQPTAKQVPADVGAGVRQQGVLQAAETRGVKPVQVDRTNQLLQDIKNILQGRPATPPEIVFNRGAGSAVADTL